MDDLLQSCTNRSAPTLKAGEVVLAVRRGLTIFSRNAQIPFMVEIGVLDGTGAVTGQKRAVFVLLTSNPPHAAQFVPMDAIPGASWMPL